MGAPHVVIIGGGFGGLTAAKALEHVPVQLTLIDCSNHHLFTPLLYQVASAGLSPADIASPIRSLLARQSNAKVLLETATGIDLAGRRTLIRDQDPVPYDYVIVAAGAGANYFGHQDWEAYAPALKTLEDAIEVRRRVLVAFERAERSQDPVERTGLLTFVVIGGGPSGVELAGAIAELRRFALRRDFRSIQPADARVILLEAGGRILPEFHELTSKSATSQLGELGVIVRTEARVTAVDDAGVSITDAKGSHERIVAKTVLWGAGVAPSALGASLGVPVDEHGRVIVESDLSVPGHPEAFVIGDMARFDQKGSPLPGVSQTAMQGATFVARRIRAAVRGKVRREERFVYFDKGIMATIGRSRAVAETFGLRLRGRLAWLAWLTVHLWYLIGFRNRAVVLLDWFWSYTTHARGARLIIRPYAPAGDTGVSVAPTGT